MDHKLTVLVRLDTDHTTAVIVVSGCLTADSYHALLPIIERTRSLAGGHPVTVDLTSADHIEASAVELLQETASGHRTTHTLHFSTPAVLPLCPALLEQKTDHELMAS